MRRLLALSLLCLTLGVSAPWSAFTAADTCRGHVCLCAASCERGAEHPCHHSPGPALRAACQHDVPFLAGATPFLEPPPADVAVARVLPQAPLVIGERSPRDGAFRIDIPPPRTIGA